MSFSAASVALTFLITDACSRFKNADKDYSAKHEAKSDLESYLHTCEQTISAPEMGSKIKRGARGAVEAEIAKALEKLEQEDVTADELKKAHLGVKRAM